MQGTTKLHAHVAQFGPQLILGRRTFAVEGISGDLETAVATFAGPRARYTGVLCINARVIGLNGAEVWSIIGSRREIARFAVHGGHIIALAGTR